MNTHRLLFRAGILAAVGLGGNAFASPAGYFHQTSASTPLSDTGGILTKIELINVPAGNWSVTGKAAIVNFAASDIGRCALLLNGTQVDGSGSELGGGSNFPAVAVLTTQYAFSATATTKVELACSHDADIVGQYVDAAASLMIVKMPAGLIR
jgi:hypothetical protein